MARLTDRELDAVLKAKTFGTPVATDLLIAEAKRLQTQALHRGIRTAFRTLGVTALFARLGRLVRRQIVCRRTRVALASLDDATLRDIGLTRGDILAQSRRCADDAVPPQHGARAA